MVEEWRDIIGFKGKYQVSSLGRVRSLDRITVTKDGRKLPCKGIILKLNQQHQGWYTRVILYGIETSFSLKYVHRLVAEAFIPNPENKAEVNHLDGNKENNCINNLEWCTRSENSKHAYETGLNPQIGDRSTSSKLKNLQVLEICNLLDNSELTQESIAKQYGVLKTQIHRIDIGERWNWLTNRKGQINNRGFKPVINCRGEIFSTITEASNKYGIETSNISKSCKNRKYSSGRYADGHLIKWNYYTKEGT